MRRTVLILSAVLAVVSLSGCTAVALESVQSNADKSAAEQKFASLGKLALAQSAFDDALVPNHPNLASFQAAPYAADLPSGITAAAVTSGVLTATIDGYSCTGITFSGIAQTSTNMPSCS